MEDTVAPPKRLQKIALPVFGVLGLFSLILILPTLLEPSSPPRNVLISNVTDQQVTVSWATKLATKGSMIVSRDGRFPFLPVFTKKLHRDDSDSNLPRQGFYTVHHVTVNGLKPSTTYQFKIYQGLWAVRQGQFATGNALSSLASPNPVYGRVLTKDSKPVVGTVVYLRAVTETKKSTLLSTLTNLEGRWSLDVANLRTEDYRDTYRISAKTQEELVVDTGARGRVKSATTPGQDKPWPEIVLK